MNDLNKKQKFLDCLGWSLIGLISLGYILFTNLFAELHIQLPFLDFPIFIGEILLMACLCIFIFKNIPIKKLEKRYWIIITFFAFVVIKAFYSYFQREREPLAFRNAALLYYPIFSIFAYSFYRAEFLRPKNATFYILIFLLLFSLGKFNGYWAFTCFSLAFALIYAQSNKKIKCVMFAILFLVAPYRQLFFTSRMMIISNVLGMIFLIIGFYLSLPIRKTVKISAVTLGIIFIIGGITQFSDKNAIKSIVKLDRIIEIFKELDIQIKNYPISEDAMKTSKKIRVYNPDVWYRNRDPDEPLYSSKTTVPEQTVPEQIEQENVPVSKAVAGIPDGPTTREVKLNNAVEQIYLPEETVAPEIQEENAVKQRHLGLAYNSALFRLFIWRDMLVELSEKKPILGFDFGKPILPKSLFTLGWASVQFMQDGWVAPHNSYLHIIYRAGIIGVLFLMTIFGILFNMIKKSIKYKSIVGILLCVCIINWFVAANFLLILELPYTAIPIWSLFGVTWAYVSNLKTKDSAQ